MFIDKVLESAGHLNVEGMNLKDAVVIHTGSNFFISETDVKEISKLVADRGADHFSGAHHQRQTLKGVKEHHLYKGEAGFFDMPECKPPFKNTILHGESVVAWILDISEEKESALYKYAIIFIPPLQSEIERMDVYIYKDGFFDFGEAFVKKIDGSVTFHNTINRAGALVYASVFLKLFSIINCKNIELVKHESPIRLNKKRAKKGRLPLMSYYTLVIKPTGKQQKSIPKHLWENRIHLCRGHFKTYTEDAPLFGKFTGRYWWQPSVRGRNREGVVMKDYRVEA